MGVHPDKTAIRAVEACGGTYTESEYLSGFAAAHDIALGEAARAVAPCDALTAELLEALRGCLAALTDPVVGTIYGDDPDWYRKVDDAADKAAAAILKATTPNAGERG